MIAMKTRMTTMRSVTKNEKKIKTKQKAHIVATYISQSSKGNAWTSVVALAIDDADDADGGDPANNHLRSDMT
jgi:hypothetical protein